MHIHAMCGARVFQGAQVQSSRQRNSQFARHGYAI